MELSKELPAQIPVNLTPTAVAGCLDVMEIIKKVLTIPPIHQKELKTLELLDAIMAMLDPVCADGKMRKDKSIDVILSSTQIKLLLHLFYMFSHSKEHKEVFLKYPVKEEQMLEAEQEIVWCTLAAAIKFDYTL